MKSEPTIGSPPMPTIVRVAEPGLLQLVADLVGQRARLRDDADRAHVEELGGDDPDVGLARREHARAVGADQPHAGVLAPSSRSCSMSRTGMPSVIAITV